MCALVDSKFYVKSNLEVYVGKQSDGPYAVGLLYFRDFVNL